jgi:hypothetical protein
VHSNPQRLKAWKARTAGAALAIAGLAVLAARPARAQKASDRIPEINSEFHFLSPLDTLLIHEEDGILNGQINAYQGEEESDVILTYLINDGKRTENHVEFRTSRVHERYFRFSGTLERGKGRKDTDPDYLQLDGTLQIVTVNGETGKETTETRQVVLKSLGANEIPE